ncbi:MAG: hypothetical protein JO023_29795 [Chloroflexi bacterium]|nr:hypothetical protein [Chloroflexota bacterium]
MIEDLMESDTGEFEGESEGEFAESEEGFDEAEEGAEDLGEAARRRRRRGQRRYYGRSRPYPGYGRAPGTVNGVGGLRVRGQNGQVTRLPFPAPLATAAETRRGLATQEVARRELEDRLSQLEARARRGPSRDASSSGLVTLALGGGLATWGLVEASKSGSGLSLGSWTKQTPTEAALVVSLTQLATSGARIATYHRYARSGFGITGDVAAAGFVLLYAFGALHQPHTVIDAQDPADIQRQLTSAQPGDRFVIVKAGSPDYGDEYAVVLTSAGTKVVRKVMS